MSNKREREKVVLLLRGFDASHYKRTEKYASQINKLCSLAALDYASLAGTIFQPDINKPFSFDDYPKAQKEAQRLAAGLAQDIQGVIVKGTASEWNAACDKNDAFLKSILRTSRLTPEEVQQYQARNLEALQSFQQRKVEGMDLSKRVWKYVGDIKDTIELGIDVGLGEGRSAQQLSRDLRECLQDPNRLFRRVRDKYGNLQLSKAAKLYHPGQGIYRSSAKNAMRLARTEVNMAYRQAEYLRWQQLDFVVGLRVMLSNNHTVLDSKGKPQPLVDICDDLKGDYPKTFRFEGWHPQCRCFVVPILSDYDEYNKGRANRLKAIARREAYKEMPSRRTVTNMPENFTKHIEGIQERAKGWKSQPYYIKHNFKGGRIEGGLNSGVALQLNGNASTETKTGGAKKPIKNNSKPCTEYDAEIAKFKRWAYAFGLDVSNLDALRLKGERNPLRAELDKLQTLSEQRQDEWLLALAELQQERAAANKEGFADIVDECRKISMANQCDPKNYYADCIKTLREATLREKERIRKAKEEAAKADYSKRMPVALKKGGAYLSGEDYKFDKRFFDMLKEEPKLKIPHTNRGSYETDNGKTVVLDSDRRNKASSWHKKAVVYHEFGHAIADQRVLITDKEVIELRNKQIARLRKKVTIEETEKQWDIDKETFITVKSKKTMMKAKAISAKIDTFASRIRRFGDEVFKRRGITRDDVLEQVGSVQDTLKSLINSPGVGWGHSTNYFNIQTLRRHEWLAHAFENTFLGNRVFKHFMPQEYKEMVDLINSLKFN